MSIWNFEELVRGIGSYFSGTYQDTEACALVCKDRQGKISGSYFGLNSEKATYIERIVGPKLLEASEELKQLDQWTKFHKLRESGE